MRKSLLGLVYGGLIIIEELNDEIVSGRNRRMVNAKCVCGKIVKYPYDSIILRQSCGCLKRAQSADRLRTHGLTQHPLFSIWQNMKNRCYNKNVWAYKYYGLKGVIVCNEWKNDFKTFYDWAITTGWQDGLSLDKYPNRNGDYKPSNCRWATWEEQVNNRDSCVFIEYNGEVNTISELAKKYNLPYKVLHSRIKKLKWNTQKSIETPFINIPVKN